MKKDKILIVDDDNTIRTTLSKILKEEKYSVFSKATAREGLGEVKKRDYDLVLLDLKLPDMDGLKLLEKIKKVIPDVCSIIITAYPEMDSAIDAVKKEVNDYITKPFDMDQVKNRIRKCLENKKLEKENIKLLSQLSLEKDKLTSILKMTKEMSSFRSIKKVCSYIIERGCELLRADKASVMLVYNNDLIIAASKGIEKNVAEKTSLKLGEAISGWVAQYGQPLLVKDIEQDVRFKSRKKEKYKSKSFLSLPMKIKKEIIGVLNFTDKRIDQGVFNDNDIKYASLLANHGAAVINNVKLYEELSNEAITDAVTGVLNHRYFKIYLDREINRAIRHSIPLSLIMIDIDQFKEYNDSFGHIMGDQALKLVAEVIKDCIRVSDILCRYGGDEFAIILPHTNLLSAMKVAEKLRKTVEVFNVHKDTNLKKMYMTLSLGIATYKKGYNNEEMIRQADQALYISKKSGRNMTTPAMNI
ncbi:MAG: diguanylate cyclase [Spirochaetes bacterium]|nr:diguanylate cyclase [Spirochaetota bacterium]